MLVPGLWFRRRLLGGGHVIGSLPFRFVNGWLVGCGGEVGRAHIIHTLKPLLTAASKKEDWEQMTARWTLKSVPSQEIVRSEYLPLSRRSFMTASRSEKPILVLPSRCFD